MLGAIDKGETVLNEVKVVTEGAEPVTVDELRQYLRQSASVDDAMIALCLTSARQKLESFLDISFCTQTLKAVYTQAGKEIDLPRGPHTAITSANRTYQGTTTALTSGTDYWTYGADYYVIYPNIVYTTKTGLINYQYDFTYTAGFGTPAQVPAKYKKLILAQAAIEYERGEATPTLHMEVLKEAELLQRKPTWF